MFYILPKAVTDATLLASSLTVEDSTPLWVTGTHYAVGDEVHLLFTHRVYRCAIAQTPSTVSPNLNPTVWVDIRPTNRWAAFDTYTGTKSAATTSISFSVLYGFFNSLALYGLQGSTYTLTLTEGLGGPVYWTATGSLAVHGLGWYSYYFGQRFAIDRLVFSGLPLRPNGVLNITIDSGIGSAVGIGMVVAGSLNPVIGGSDWGGSDWGAEAEPITYSYTEPAEDGTIKIVRRFSATNLTSTVTMPTEFADQAVKQLQDILDVPVAWTCTTLPGYNGLSTFGLGSGRMRYESYGVSKFEINVRGIV